MKTTPLALNNGRTCRVRHLEAADEADLHAYLNGLSAESRSRFGPHPFDRETVRRICQSLPDDVLRFVAFSPENTLVAYLLVKRGMLPDDRHRYEARNLVFDDDTTCTFAPSVADAWQGSGLGSALFGCILDELRAQPFRRMVLWGGVQASNERARRYYARHGFEAVGHFWHNDKDNVDMVRRLDAGPPTDFQA